MRVGASRPLADPADLRFRMSTVRTGCVLTLAMGVAGLVYLAATWGTGHRLLLSVFTIVIIGSAFLVWMLPMEKVIAGRWRETFFFGWTSAMLIGILTLMAFDPARPSPLALPLFMPLLFAGMSYPLHLASAFAAIVPVGYVVVAVGIGE